MHFLTEPLSGESTTGDPATVKKKLKMKNKGDKKRKIKEKDSPALGDEDIPVAPHLSNSGVEQSSSFLGEEEDTEE